LYEPVISIQRLKSAAKLVPEYPLDLPKDYGIMALLLRRNATLRDLFRFLLANAGASFWLSF
jgi:hypothetical protein